MASKERFGYSEMYKYFKKKGKKKHISFDHNSIYCKPSMYTPGPGGYSPPAGDFSYHEYSPTMVRHRKRFEAKRKLLPKRTKKIWEGFYEKEN
jgi:hypothetical protein